MKTREKLITKFTELTGFDLEELFLSAYIFFENDYPNLASYYEGNLNDIGELPYKNLTYLEEKISVYFKTVELFKHHFKESEWYYLFEDVELLDNSIKTCKNLHKWLRSSVTYFGPKKSSQIVYQLSESETLEKVSRNLLNSSNSNDDWKDLAFDNNLSETNYSIEGGVKIKLSVTDQIFQESLEEVVDAIYGTSSYGRDLNRKLQFVDDDLLVLSEQDTVLQTVEILANLYKESNPEFPEDGLQKNFFIGSNRNLFAIPILTRQLNEIFATDKTLTNLSIKAANIENDTFVLDFTVETALGEQISQKSVV